MAEMSREEALAILGRPFSTGDRHAQQHSTGWKTRTEAKLSARWRDRLLADQPCVQALTPVEAVGCDADGAQADTCDGRSERLDDLADALMILLGGGLL